MPSYSIYLHIPFCIHRCAYCDFNTYSGLEEVVPYYVNALCREIQFCRASAGEKLPVHTIFMGGGTPSLVPAAELERIFQALKTAFDLEAGAEITLEANPGTLTADYLIRLRAIGVNRLSLGMQSAHPDDLRVLERQHSLEDVLQAVSWARKAGFSNINLDLIFGIPYQTLVRWGHTLSMSMALLPEHISLYALTLEHDTPMGKWVQGGLLPEPDPDLAADMYELASERLESSGYTQYEISNWARSNDQGNLLSCQHNLQYWHNLPYLGFGAGAHGYAGGIRTANVLSPQAYIDRCMDGNPLPFPRTPATVEVNSINREAEIKETMMVGLRLTQEGVSSVGFEERFGVSLKSLYGSEIDRLAGFGLLEWAGEGNETLRLTKRGRLLGNQVFLSFI